MAGLSVCRDWPSCNIFDDHRFEGTVRFELAGCERLQIEIIWVINMVLGSRLRFPVHEFPAVLLAKSRRNFRAIEKRERKYVCTSWPGRVTMKNREVLISFHYLVYNSHGLGKYRMALTMRNIGNFLNFLLFLGVRSLGLLLNLMLFTPTIRLVTKQHSLNSRKRNIHTHFVR